MRISLCTFAAILLSGCAMIEGAPVRMGPCDPTAIQQSGLPPGEPCWGVTAQAQAIVRAE